MGDRRRRACRLWFITAAIALFSSAPEVAGQDVPPAEQHEQLLRELQEHRSAGRIVEATNAARRRVDLEREMWGAESERCVLGVVELSTLLSQRGSYDEARKLLDVARALLECGDDVGEMLPTVLLAIGSVDAAEGEYEQARKHFALVLERADAKENPDFGRVVKTLTLLEGVCRALGDHPAALGYLERRIELQEKTLAADHVELVRARRRLEILRELVQPEPESEPEAEGSIESLEDTLARASVAVVLPRCENDDPRYAEWAVGLRWLLRKKFGELKSLRVAPQKAVDAARRVLELPADAPLDADLARRVGELTGVRWVVRSVYRRDGDGWRFTIRLTLVAERLRLPDVDAIGDDLLEAGLASIETLLEKQHVPLAEEEQARVRKLPTGSIEAFEKFALGIARGMEPSRIEEATKLYDDAIRLDARFAAPYTGKGFLLAFAEELASAADAARRGIELDPGDAVAHLLVGHIAMRRERRQESIEEMAAALRLDPGLSAASTGLARLHGSVKQWGDAVRHLERVRALDPLAGEARAMLGEAYLRVGLRDDSVRVVDEALRIPAPALTPKAIEIAARVYELAGELAGAAGAYRRLAEVARDTGADADAVRTVLSRAEALEARLEPRVLRASRPRDYTAAELAAALEEKLTTQERELAEFPLESTEAIAAWARELTAGRVDKMARARALFDGLSRRIVIDPEGGIRTAREVFAAWGDPTETFNCQEYAKLYVALARAVGVDAYLVYLERDHRDRPVYHACVAVFVDEGCFLVDPAYRWFGVRHRRFQILDDLQVVAVQLFHDKDGESFLERCRAGMKLFGELPYGRLALVRALAGEKRFDEARVELDRLETYAPERWDTKHVRGTIAANEDRLDEAERELMAALDIAPNAPSVHVALGGVLALQGRFLESRREYREALRLGLTTENEALARRGLAAVERELEKASLAPGAGPGRVRGSSESPELVGSIGTPAQIRVAGCEMFSDAAIVAGITSDVGFLLAAHPRARRADFLAWLEDRVRSGYLLAGFPDVDVRARVSSAEGTYRGVTILVREGERLTAGPPEVEGNSIVEADTIAAQLTKRHESVDVDGERYLSEPFWIIDEPARLDSVSQNRATRLAKKAYEERGYLDVELTVDLQERDGGTSVPVVRVASEGAVSRVGAIEFLGELADNEDMLRERLEIRSGQPFDPALPESIRERLEEMGRYFSVEVTAIDGARSTEKDLEIRLRQADFVDALDAPQSEELGVLRKASAWLSTPSAWDVDHELRFDAIADDGRPFSVELVIHGRSIAVAMRLPGSTEDDVRLVLREGMGVLDVPVLGVLAPFDLSDLPHWSVYAEVKALGPEGDSRFQLHARAGLGTTKRPGRAHLHFDLQPLALVRMFRDDLALDRLDDGWQARWTGSEMVSARAHIDPATGALRLDGSIDIDADVSRLWLRSAPGLIQAAWTRATTGEDARARREVDFPAALATLTSHFLCRELARADAPRTGSQVATELVVRTLLRESSPFVERLRALDIGASAEGDEFVVPSSIPPSRLRRMDSFVVLRQLVTVFAPQLAVDSWPRALLTEAACVLTGEGKFTQQVLAGLYDSPAVGPVGHWVTAMVLRAGGFEPLAKRFGERALSLRGEEGLRREIALLETLVPGMIDDLGVALRALDSETVQRIREEIESSETPSSDRILDLLDRRAALEPREAAAEMLIALWGDAVRRTLRAPIIEAWPDLESVGATVVDVDHALRLLARGEHQLAENALRQAIERAPRDPRLNLVLGELLLSEGRLREATNRLALTLTLDPASEPVRARLAESLERLLEGASRAHIVRARASSERAVRATSSSDLRFTRMSARTAARLALLDGDLATAIGGLEAERRRTGHDSQLDGLLAALRQQALPDLPTYASIDAALEQSRQVIASGSTWRMAKGVAPPSQGMEWTLAGFDDSTWSLAASPVGYGEPGMRTTLSDMRNSYTTVCLRQRFQSAGPGLCGDLQLHCRADDGFIAWLNGVFIGKANAPSSYDYRAVSVEVAQEPLLIFRVPLPSELVRPGVNVIAIRGFNRSVSESSDFVLDPVVVEVTRFDAERDDAVLQRFLGVAEGGTTSQRLLYLEGRLRQRAGQYDEAIERFEQVFSLDSNAVEAKERYAECHALRAEYGSR